MDAKFCTAGLSDSFPFAVFTVFLLLIVLHYGLSLDRRYAIAMSRCWSDLHRWLGDTLRPMLWRRNAIRVATWRSMRTRKPTRYESGGSSLRHWDPLATHLGNPSANVGLPRVNIFTLFLSKAMAKHQGGSVPGAPRRIEVHLMVVPLPDPEG